MPCTIDGQRLVFIRRQHLCAARFDVLSRLNFSRYHPLINSDLAASIARFLTTVTQFRTHGLPDQIEEIQHLFPRETKFLRCSIAAI